MAGSGWESGTQETRRDEKHLPTPVQTFGQAGQEENLWRSQMPCS